MSDSANECDKSSTGVDVYLVEYCGKFEVFANAAAAEAYAALNPSAVTTRRPLRYALNEAILVHDRRAIIDKDGVRYVRWAEIMEFYDADELPQVEVEVYEKAAGEVHVVGFSADSDLLSARMAEAIASAEDALTAGVSAER